MKILGMEKLSLVDYDGYVAATLFTGGCNFRCPFCHNSPLVLDFKNLPELSTEDVLSYLKKRKIVLDAVCVSGGEPTLQKDLPDFILKLKELGYKVKLDTNGTNFDMIKALNEDGLVDYFAMDIKNDLANYSPIIGLNKFDTSSVEKSVEYFLAGKAKYEFRTTLIKEFHSQENIKLIGQWIKGADKYFLQKFKDSDGCIQSNLSPVDNDSVLGFLNVLKKTIPNTYLRGYDL